MSQTPLSRRRFLQSVATAAAVGPFLSIPSRAFGATTLRHASIGAAGQALSDVNAFAKHPAFELVAVADVDLCRMEPLQRLFPKVRVYQDWREMLDRERSHIDSVNVSLPDHMHCAVALEAMKRGKPVYVQKPLCNTLRETRLLTKEARRRGLTTQMGIQVSSSRPQRYGEALVRSGIVGKIKEVHTFSNKNWGDDKPLPEAVDPVPAPFDWDEWVGVSAPRPFKRAAYHPGEWRRRVGFGTGTLGDMGCHIYSPPYRALKLTSPLSVTAYGPAPTEESWATKARVKLTYPGTEFTAGRTVDVWWYDGGELPPDAIREPIGARFPDQGSVVVGTDGLLVLPHGSTPAFVLPESKMPSPPEIDLPERDHYREFVDIVLAGGKEKCSASFDYAGPLTESVLIGNIAAHFPGETLEFDAKALSFPRKRDANQYLTRSYRSGWDEIVVRRRLGLTWTLLATLFVVFGAPGASAQGRTLRWVRLAVTAHLDADGRLHVQERHAIVFDGHWNGGERTFRTGMDQTIHLDRLSRIDESGAAVPLRENKELAAVDDYAWSGSTLRWRSRLPSDPPFQQREITYVLEYTASNILIPEDDYYLIDHNFGLPDLEWPIDALSVDLSLDPVWQGRESVPAHLTRVNAPRGENVTVTARLRHTGAIRPAAVNLGAPAWLRVALLALLLGGTGFFALQFWQREKALGRFEPLADPASIDRRWLERHLLTFPPEVVGAMWDDRTGAAEVAALIARLAHEGKLGTRVDDGELFLTLRRPRSAFEGYEGGLVASLFIDGDTTSTSKIKAHYKTSGFDPVSVIRDPLKQLAGQTGASAAPGIDRSWTALLALTGLALLGLGATAGALNILGGFLGTGLILALYLPGLAGAIDYRRRLSKLGALSVEFVPMLLLIVAVPAILLAGITGLRFHGLMLGGVVLVSLAAVRSLLNLAKSRDTRERLDNRRRLWAARDYFARQLKQPNPALDDGWFPYVLAFGLSRDADRWFRSFGGQSVSSSAGTFGSSSGSTSSSGSSGGSGWTGFGGGASGGAGATGAWAVAATTMAAGVASPSSSSSGGSSGSSSGGSSGGGGGGGW